MTTEYERHAQLAEELADRSSVPDWLDIAPYEYWLAKAQVHATLAAAAAHRTALDSKAVDDEDSPEALRETFLVACNAINHTGRNWPGAAAHMKRLERLIAETDRQIDAEGAE